MHTKNFNSVEKEYIRIRDEQYTITIKFYIDTSYNENNVKAITWNVYCFRHNYETFKYLGHSIQSMYMDSKLKPSNDKESQIYTQYNILLYTYEKELEHMQTVTKRYINNVDNINNIITERIKNERDYITNVWKNTKSKDRVTKKMLMKNILFILNKTTMEHLISEINQYYYNTYSYFTTADKNETINSLNREWLKKYITRFIESCFKDDI
jgi:hypothetical protein